MLSCPVLSHRVKEEQKFQVCGKTRLLSPELSSTPLMKTLQSFLIHLRTPEHGLENAFSLPFSPSHIFLSSQLTFLSSGHMELLRNSQKTSLSLSLSLSFFPCPSLPPSLSHPRTLNRPSLAPGNSPTHSLLPNLNLTSSKRQPPHCSV